MTMTMPPSPVAGYALDYPGRIRFGRAERMQLHRALPPGPVFIVTGRHARARVERELLPQLTGRAVQLFPDVPPDPPLADVELIRRAARELGAAAIIGWGGGSAIDAAKAAALLLHEPLPVREYFYGRSKPAGRKVFLATLPTTAGTGAEITGNAVLSDPETGIKQSLRHDTMTADLAIIDPELTYDCPPTVTAASGFDALTQAIESFLSRKSNAASRALALQATRQIYFGLSDAFTGDCAAKDLVAEGSMLTAMAFSSSGLGAVHGIGHPLGSICHIPHGVCCAVLLPTILKWNLAADRQQLTELAYALLGQEPEVLIQTLKELRQNLGLPSNFRSYGLRREQYDFIIGNCRSGSMKCNPRTLSDEEVRQILEALS